MRCSTTLLTYLVALVVPTCPVIAQAGLHAIGVRAFDERLGDMTGLALLASPIGRLQVGAEYVRSNFSALGQACAGFIVPEMDCDLEEIRQHGLMFSLLAENRFLLVRRANVEFEFVTAGRIVEIHSRIVGVRSGRRLPASKAMIGGHVGIAAGWYPWYGHRLGMHVSATVGGLQPMRESRVFDGYTPFEHSISFSRASIGVRLR